MPLQVTAPRLLLDIVTHGLERISYEIEQLHGMFRIAGIRPLKRSEISGINSDGARRNAWAHSPGFRPLEAVCASCCALRLQ